MAKRKVVEPDCLAIEDWNVATELGAELVQLTQRIASEEAEYNKKEQESRLTLTQEHAELRHRIETIERSIERFCTIRKSEFDSKRSRDLQHIVVGFRTHPPKVKQLSGVKMEFVLRLIKASRFAERFIVVKEDLSKESILTAYKADAASGDETSIGDAELYKLGLQIIQEETFSWSPKLAVEEQ